MTTATRTRSVYWRRRAVLAAAASVGLIMTVRSCASSGPPHLQRVSGQRPAVPITATYTPTPSATPTAAPTAAAQGDVEAAGGDAAATDAAAAGATAAAATAAPTGAPTATPAAAPVPSATPAKPGATAKPGKGKATAAPAGAVAPAAAGATAAAPAAVPGVPECAKSALGVELRADSPTYSSTSKPKFYIGISNIGNAPCRVDLGSIALSFTVRSGPDRIWSSHDCQGKGTHDVRTLAPGQKLWGRSIWNQSRSKPGCPTGQPDAKAGTYTLDGSAAGVKAQKKVVFRVR